jgi:rare lipoprotein A
MAIKPNAQKVDRAIDEGHIVARLKIAAAAAAVTAVFVVAAPPASSQQSFAVVKEVVGQASWYGAKFHGKLTASGEPFDMAEMTAAHRTLPFGTRVRVINPGNGRSVVVRINDRGPFSGRRIIDLSRKAAELIGLKAKGVGRVRIEVLEKT